MGCLIRVSDIAEDLRGERFADRAKTCRLMAKDVP